jgi:hypothetical protein
MTGYGGTHLSSQPPREAQIEDGSPYDPSIKQDSNSKIISAERTGGVAQVVEWPPSKCKAPVLNTQYC